MPADQPTSLPPIPAARIAIRVKPGASRTKVGGAYGSDGAPGGARARGVENALVVAVQERAVDGKATEAALRALAAALGVPRRKIRLVSGATSRDKIVEIPDPPAGLGALLDQLRAG
jgi:uncharacterized protein YggU (UPF0235/DUF167 family)